MSVRVNAYCNIHVYYCTPTVLVSVNISMCERKLYIISRLMMLQSDMASTNPRDLKDAYSSAVIRNNWTDLSQYWPILLPSE